MRASWRLPFLAALLIGGALPVAGAPPAAREAATGGPGRATASPREQASPGRLNGRGIARGPADRGASGRRFGAADGVGSGGFGYGGFGYGGGFGTTVVTPSLAAPDRAGPPRLPPAGLLVPRPPRCPLVIEIGKGLSRSVRSRVIAGRPACV